MIPQKVNKIVLFPLLNFNSITIGNLFKLANLSKVNIDGMINFHLIENCFYNIYCTNKHEVFHNKNFKNSYEIKKEILEGRSNLSYKKLKLKGFTIKVNTYIYITRINFKNILLFFISFWIIFSFIDKIWYFFFYLGNKNNYSVINLIYNEVKYEIEEENNDDDEISDYEDYEESRAGSNNEDNIENIKENKDIY